MWGVLVMVIYVSGLDRVCGGVTVMVMYVSWLDRVCGVCW